MPVPSHFKFTFRGVFTNTPEIWSFGVKMARNVTAGSDADLTSINQAAVTAAIDQLFSTSGAGVSSTVVGTDWRAYVIGTNGLMEGNPLLVDLTGAGVSGMGALRYPTQVALAITTVAANRGPARFGRFYIPGPTENIGTDHRLTAVQADAYAAAGAEFLKDLSSAIDLPGTIASAAAVHVSPSNGGVLQDIDHVECGRVLDTIRSRRNGLIEDRQARPHIDW